MEMVGEHDQRHWYHPKLKVTPGGKLACADNAVSGMLLMPCSEEGIEHHGSDPVGLSAAQKEEVSEDKLIINTPAERKSAG